MTIRVSLPDERIALGGAPLYPALPGEKQVMEMTEYGKHGKP
jgi:hypothetical protein